MKETCSTQSNLRSGALAVFVWAAIVGLTSSAALSQSSSSPRGIEIEPVLSSERGSFRTLLIGVNDYERLKDLKYGEADIKAFRDHLTAMGFGPQVKCMTTDADDASDRPTYRNINERLSTLFAGLDKNSVVIIVFSGHGASFPKRDAGSGEERESVLCPLDARVAAPYETMISRSSLYQRLEKCPARFKWLLIDACRDHQILPDNAKQAFDEAASAKGFAKTLSDTTRLPTATIQMVSCMPGECSYEDPALSHGIFMNYIIEACSGKADEELQGNRNGLVSFRELKDYVYRKTSERAWQVHNAAQTPQFYAPQELSDFDIVRVKPSLETHIDEPAAVPASPPPTMPAQDAQVRLVGEMLPWPFDTAEAKHQQEEAARSIGQSVEMTNAIGMKLRLIPAGEFLMGSDKSAEKLAEEYGTSASEFMDEHPRHCVRITKPFYFGTCEVTQGEWEKVMGTTPWKGKGYVREGADYPATCVSWDDAVTFCKKLSENEGVRYHLPTEAEWEYSCRAGTATEYNFGSDASGLGTYAWYDENASDVGENYYAHRVGKKSPNA